MDLDFVWWNSILTINVLTLSSIDELFPVLDGHKIKTEAKWSSIVLEAGTHLWSVKVVVGESCVD